MPSGLPVAIAASEKVRNESTDFEAADEYPDSLILLGAKAKIPKTGYGYIEPELTTTEGALGRGRRLMSVKRSGKNLRWRPPWPW